MQLVLLIELEFRESVSENIIMSGLLNFPLLAICAL